MGKCLCIGLDFVDSFERFGQKIGNKNCLNQYTKIYE